MAGLFIFPSSPGGWKEPWSDYLSVADQKIPDWLVKITFWEGAETTIRSTTKSRFGIMSFI